MTRPIPAIVLAAGASRRMGRPKLTLPLAGGKTVLGRVLDALAAAGAAPIVVVGPPRDAPGWPALADECERPDVQLLIPDQAMADMRESACLGLAALEAEGEAPGFLLTPGDTVGITPELVARVIDCFRADPSRLVIPVHDGKRGHPVAFPRDLIAAIESLPPDVGLNAVRERNLDRVTLLEVDDAGALADVDTPEDYELWRPR